VAGCRQEERSDLTCPCVKRVDAFLRGFHEVMLGPVITPISCAAPPMDDELSLADAVADPIKTHFHSFGAFLLDRIVSDAHGRAVVSDHGGSALWVSELF
jgi:hypothetical protein